MGVERSVNGLFMIVYTSEILPRLGVHGRVRSEPLYIER